MPASVVAVQHASDIFSRLNEKDQHFALDFLSRLEKSYEYERQQRNAEYLDKVQRAIDQIAAGQGIEREIIEVPDHD